MEPQTARKDEREAIKEVKGFEWEGDYRPAAQKAIKEMLEGQMAPWADQHLAEVGSRGGVDRRNGSYHRRLTTEVGDIVLSVKRTRTASACGIFSAYARRPAHVDGAILDCFLLGASTRKVGRIIAPLLGEQVSASPVSRIAKQLDRAVAAYHARPWSAFYTRCSHTRMPNRERHPDSTDTNLVTLPDPKPLRNLGAVSPPDPVAGCDPRRKSEPRHPWPAWPASGIGSCTPSGKKLATWGSGGHPAGHPAPRGQREKRRGKRSPPFVFGLWNRDRSPRSGPGCVHSDLAL